MVTLEEIRSAGIARAAELANLIDDDATTIAEEIRDADPANMDDDPLPSLLVETDVATYCLYLLDDGSIEHQAFGPDAYITDPVDGKVLALVEV